MFDFSHSYAIFVRLILVIFLQVFFEMYVTGYMFQNSIVEIQLFYIYSLFRLDIRDDVNHWKRQFKIFYTNQNNAK